MGWQVVAEKAWLRCLLVQLGQGLFKQLIFVAQ
jgi:hypothetical protein